MKKRYYLCAYGASSTRWAQANSSDAAAMDSYGTVHRVTVLDVGTRSPKYMTQKRKREIREELAKLHELRTGNKLEVRV